MPIKDLYFEECSREVCDFRYSHSHEGLFMTVSCFAAFSLKIIINDTFKLLKVFFSRIILMSIHYITLYHPDILDYLYHSKNIKIYFFNSEIKNMFIMEVV